MIAWSPVEWLTLGVLVLAAAGILALAIRRNIAHRDRTDPIRPHAVSCLLCGKKNKVTQKEWERASVTCRCGQQLYLAAPRFQQSHPPQRG
jgi:hypothetical protein